MESIRDSGHPVRNEDGADVVLIAILPDGNLRLPESDNGKNIHVSSR